VPGKTILDIPIEEQAQMLRELRQARYGYLLAVHILLLCAEGRTPSEIADFLLCSRSSVYRTVAAYRQGGFFCGWTGEPSPSAPESRASVLHSWQRSLLSLLKRTPQAYGWCRTRWSCATLGLELATRRGVTRSRETIRRCLHELGYVWKRARHAAKDDDPERTGKLARIRHVAEHLRPSEVLFFVDELDIQLLAKLGSEWMLKGTQREVLTPGANKKYYLAGALNFLSGKMLHVVGERKNRWLFIDLLMAIGRAYPATKIEKIYVVADNYRIHKAKAVLEWLANHPRFEIIWLPTYCPKANPIERAFGDVHDKCTRNHKRTRLAELVSDVVWHLKGNGPWRYRLSEIYYAPEVDAAVDELLVAEKLKAA
jgi:transposase